MKYIYTPVPIFLPRRSRIIQNRIQYLCRTRRNSSHLKKNPRQPSQLAARAGRPRPWLSRGRVFASRRPAAGCDDGASVRTGWRVGWCGARQERLLGLRWMCYHPSSCDRSRRKFERAVCALSTMLSHPNLSCVARLMRPPPVISAPHPPCRLQSNGPPLAYHPTTAGRGRRPASLR